MILCQYLLDIQKLIIERNILKQRHKKISRLRMLIPQLNRIKNYSDILHIKRNSFKDSIRVVSIISLKVDLMNLFTFRFNIDSYFSKQNSYPQNPRLENIFQHKKMSLIVRHNKINLIKFKTRIFKNLNPYSNNYKQQIFRQTQCRRIQIQKYQPVKSCIKFVGISGYYFIFSLYLSYQPLVPTFTCETRNNLICLIYKICYSVFITNNYGQRTKLGQFTYKIYFY
ncbi:unnamed protein product (macronuclear) [Paramecium tetraurelia]|uniref:Transmembrane protein n=1 Tax=Paramecium tetraurelia TaxID=5888 RepID=A0EEL9_PARTE|nr:uncharacterized protein GSPATT00026082001 [Paramecium tetraurelia]CAK93758.1 unnamed protein product [Paramecium tetraurelia]|eukprot:XP_001461133.1 hypothetical protein (macronuclear) [Paramecium tetraurelia strain d4-2]